MNMTGGPVGESLHLRAGKAIDPCHDYILRKQNVVVAGADEMYLWLCRREAVFEYFLSASRFLLLL